MAEDNITDKNTLKSWFKRGLKPLELQFHAWMDSYWHKSESIPTSSIENLETTLNSKAESSSVEVITKEIGEITKGIDEHINDTGMHKTEKEQSKLDNLADNPDATYASKDELGGVEPVIFYATYTDNADKTIRRYQMSTNQKAKMVEYFEEGKTSPVILQVSPVDDATQYENYVMTTQRSVGNERIFYFVRIGSPLTFTSNCLHRIQMRYNQLPSGASTSVAIVGGDLKFGESEYKNTRYMGIEDGYDMNTFTQSGGIVAMVRPATEEIAAISGLNVPEGFTMMNGYVLTDSAGCTQVISDAVLKKTVMRSKLMNGEWTDWGEVITKTNETIVFHATYSTVDGVKKYVFDSSQFTEYASYFDNVKTNPVILDCRASDNTHPETEIYALEKVESDATVHRMYFIAIESGVIKRIRLQGSKLSSGGWLSVINIYENIYPFSESEYQHNRYITMESYDMNNMIESGGISGYSDNEIIGTNIPKGFTDFYGYVLSNNGGGGRKSRCCTQVVTDMILQKTMIRSSVPTDDYRSVVWLPWKELGGNASDIHVVAEYPTDLSGYADGSIFIKQQAS